MFGYFFSLAIILLLCVFANILHVYFTCLPALAVIIYHQILFFFFVFFHIDIDKDADCLESNNDSLNDLGYFFQLCFFLESLVL